MASPTRRFCRYPRSLEFFFGFFFLFLSFFGHARDACRFFSDTRVIACVRAFQILLKEKKGVTKVHGTPGGALHVGMHFFFWLTHGSHWTLLDTDHRRNGDRLQKSSKSTMTAPSGASLRTFSSK